MLGSTNIVAFVPTRDAAKARAFYEGVLGMHFVKDDGFAMVLDANGIMIRVAKVGNDFTPAQFTILGWQVPGIEDVVRSLREKGVQFEISDSSSRTNSESGLRPWETKWRGSRIRMAMSCQFPSTCRNCVTG